MAPRLQHKEIGIQHLQLRGDGLIHVGTYRKLIASQELLKVSEEMEINRHTTGRPDM